MSTKMTRLMARYCWVGGLRAIYWSRTKGSRDGSIVKGEKCRLNKNRDLQCVGLPENLKSVCVCLNSGSKGEDLVGRSSRQGKRRCGKEHDL